MVNKNRTVLLKKIIYFVVFLTIVLIIFSSLREPHTNTDTPLTTPATTKVTIKYELRPPIKVNNYFPRGKQVTLDVVLAFIATRVDLVLEHLESWNEKEALPCDEYLVSHYYAGAQSNLVFYLNFGPEPQIEDTVNAKVESSIWRKCFNQIKFVYANNTLEEDAYPKGPSVQFYKYYTIGPPSDYFFWMEADVKPLRKDWQIELFRLVIQTNEVRGDRAFFVMGSTYVGMIEKSPHGFFPLATHINGNALYWNSMELYDNFLHQVRWYEEREDAFDFDLNVILHDPKFWDLARDIRQEFIYSDFIRNYNFYSYDRDEELANFPRTFFVHHSKSGKED